MTRYWARLYWWRRWWQTHNHRHRWFVEDDILDTRACITCGAGHPDDWGVRWWR